MPMSTTGLSVFDTTLQKTNHWLKELSLLLGWEDRQRCYQALRATLHALRDRLTIDEVAQLAAQLPMLIRGVYYEGWDPSRNPTKERDETQFLSRILAGFPPDTDIDPERIARAVFSVLTAEVSRGEIEDVRRILPKQLRRLWLTDA